jgi:signal transduction histidine kinase/CheY-like chemotaxis protein
MIPKRSRDFVSAIALFAAVLITLGVPAGYALIRGIDEVAMLSLRTRLNAARAGRLIYANERTWRFQAVRLAELIETTDPEAPTIRQRLIDANGRIVVEEAGIVPWPAFERRSPIVIGDRTIAVLEARTSQRPLLIETMAVVLISGLVGFGAWIAVRLLPLRALDEVMTELVEQNTRIQIATHEAELLREQKQAAAEASAAKSGFLAMMSHEIRTPMNAVLGLAGSLLDDDIPPAQREVVEAIRDSGDDLLRILNDILDFSKLDANRMTFENAPFAPGALTDGVIGILGARVAAKGLRIVTETDPRLPGGLLGDAGRIRQVLINLVSNAIKFTLSGRITVQVRRASVPPPNACVASACVEWVVSDTGIGIAPDRIGSLFNEFMQADSSITRRFGGSGLGLAISKRLVAQMNGVIEVESTPGRGTTFRVRLTLPCAEKPSEQPSRTSAVTAAFQSAVKRSGRTPRLLFAEDNPTNQFVARQLLKDSDIQVDMVGDGLEAVDAASRFAYDVICMDVRMPEMDGLAATRMIRSRGGALAAIPIIALTANAFPEDVQACFDAGMNQFLAKPVTRAALLTALMRALFASTEDTADVAKGPVPASAT